MVSPIVISFLKKIDRCEGVEAGNFLLCHRFHGEFRSTNDAVQRGIR